MIRSILTKIALFLALAIFTSTIAQEADPIEAARQAKLAAEKAAAEAEAATGAAIEAAAAKAAAAAREKVIADRKAEEERKRLEKEAAEAAEVDAAAEAAALEARRKLAAELGLVGLVLALLFFSYIIIKALKIILINKSVNDNQLLIPFFIIFLTEIFPLKTTGSFFTTTNATFIFILISFIVGLIEKEKIFYER